MFKLGIPQVVQRLALVLLSISLLGYVGYLLSGLYRSRNELRLYQQELLLRESGKRAQSLEYFFSERMNDLRELAENHELRTYFENKALGMSMQYGLAASLYGATESFQAFRAKSRLAEAEIYPRLVFLDAAQKPLIDVRSGAVEDSQEALDLERVRSLVVDARPPEPALALLGGQLVATIPYRFKAQSSGQVVALLSIRAIYQHFVAGDDPSRRLIALCYDDRLLFADPAPGALLGLDAIRDALARPAEGDQQAGDRQISAVARGPRNAEVSALRTPVGGTRLSLVTFIPTVELRSQSPRALIAVVGGIGVLIVLLGLLSALNYRRALQTLEQVVRRTPFGIAVVSRDRVVLQANEAAGAILSASARGLSGQRWERFVGASPPPGEVFSSSREVAAVDAQGGARSLLLAEIPARLGNEEGFIEAFVDLSERKLLEAQLGQAQKLEAVGQLAAGIAHEINTPAQYVGDSVQFLAQSFQDLQALLSKYREAIADLSATPEHRLLQDAMRKAEEEIDIAFVAESAPAAFDRATDGISRVVAIVGAMKEFAHPDRREKNPADLNRALQNSLTIAHHEYTQVADVEAQLEALPPVMCHLGEMNQVFLNILVNAAHAIADVVGEGGGKGRIRVHTACLGEAVRIDIEDTGCGIPEAIRHRVFDPFFTTKPVGRGTGQGLTIARSVVVDKHGGSLTFESTVGKGTTFTILLPVGAAGADTQGDQRA